MCGRSKAEPRRQTSDSFAMLTHISSITAECVFSAPSPAVSALLAGSPLSAVSSSLRRCDFTLLCATWRCGEEGGGNGCVSLGKDRRRGRGRSRHWLGAGAHLPLQGLQVQTLLLQLVLLLLDLVHQLVDAPVLGRQEPLEADNKER